MLHSSLKSEPLRTERQNSGRRILLRDLVVEIEGLEIIIPVGAETDFSTIPWYGRILVRWSKVDIAGVVHDWLYQAGDLSRRRSDRIWRLVALRGEYHANAFQAWIGWAALRVGGWRAWNLQRKNSSKSETAASAE